MSDPLRVCIDLTAAAHGGSGIGRYSRELALALLTLADEGGSALQLDVFVASASTVELPAELGGLRRVTCRASPRRWRLRVAGDYLLRHVDDSRFAGADVFHGTDHLLPRLAKLAGVLTLHDVTFALFPEAHTLMNRTFQQIMVPRFLQRADAVIAVSESTRQDALEMYGLDPRRVHVVHEGVSDRFSPASPDMVADVARRLNLPERFVLFVGTLEPRKNLHVLIDAFERLVDAGSDIDLVVAGGLGWHYGKLLERLRTGPCASRIRVTGRVHDDDLPALYTAASALVLPSLYEGFGLPVLEAMACGTPVVASRRPALPEIVGDAGVLVDANDPAALADSLAKLLQDASERQRLSDLGLERASKFTWRRAAEGTVEVYRAAAERSAGSRNGRARSLNR